MSANFITSLIESNVSPSVIRILLLQQPHLFEVNDHQKLRNYLSSNNYVDVLKLYDDIIVIPHENRIKKSQERISKYGNRPLFGDEECWTPI